MLLDYKCNGERHTVWQIGLILWEMVYGAFPFKSVSAITDNQQTKFEDTEVTIAFQNLVNSCLNPNPLYRPTLYQIFSHV